MIYYNLKMLNQIFKKKYKIYKKKIVFHIKNYNSQ